MWGKVKIGILGCFASVWSGAHFSPVDNSGKNMTMIVLENMVAHLGDVSLTVGDEIGVFNKQQQCVGALIWQGKNDAFPVYGYQQILDGKVFSGSREGEELEIRFWDKETKRELLVHPEIDVEGSYATDKIKTLQRISVEQTSSIYNVLNSTLGVDGHSILLQFGENLERYYIQVYDVNGQEVFKHKEKVKDNKALLSMKEMNLVEGSYLIKVHFFAENGKQIVKQERFFFR